MSAALLARTEVDMLHELFTYLTTPCEPSVRRMGYLYEAIALRGRYRRCRADWNGHLDRSRRAILETAAACRTHGAALILGSGLLLDVPLVELADRFQEVILADIVHLPQVHRYARRFGNVRLLPYDVSTVARRLFEVIRSGGCELPEPTDVDLRLASATTMVVSLNLLSQLSVLPRRYAFAHLPGLSQSDLETWCRRIVASHYAALLELDCEVCLIADYAYAKRNRHGQVCEEGSTLHGFELASPSSAWTWRIAPLGEQAHDYAKELRVGAWRMHPDTVR